MRVFAVKYFAVFHRAGFRLLLILTNSFLCSGSPKHGYLGLGEVLQSSSGGNASGNKLIKKDSLTTFSPSSKFLTLCFVTTML
jgi:hypothetical protein